MSNRARSAERAAPCKLYNLAVRRFLFIFLALLAAQPAAAYRYDSRLSRKLKAELEVKLRSTATGRELMDRLADHKAYKTLRVLARNDKSDFLASYDPEPNVVYLNSRFILKFFDAKKFRDAKVVEILWSNKEVREELVKYISPIYLHELVHALQCSLYPEYRQDSGGNPLEFEYEAYLTEDMYVHELMKASPSLLKDFIRGAYTDPYTSSSLGSYLTLSLDPGRYKEKIRRYYEEMHGGYLSLAQAAEQRQNGLADSKILAYASGGMDGYKKDHEALARLKKEKDGYAAFLEEFYDTRWPEFSADALLFVGGIALEEKNYPLALDCLAVADANSGKYGLDKEALDSLRTKGALAVLEAAAFLKDNSGKMSIEELSQHLKSLDKACVATGRPFPEELASLRDKTYPEAFRFYAAKHAVETDPAKKDYYGENMEFFSAAAGSPDVPE